MVRVLSPDDAAEQLRVQASSCRRLARNSRTELGSTALLAVASQFESDAFRIERQGRDDANDEGIARGRVRAALVWQDALWLRMHPDATRTTTCFGIGELDG